MTQEEYEKAKELVEEYEAKENRKYDGEFIKWCGKILSTRSWQDILLMRDMIMSRIDTLSYFELQKLYKYLHEYDNRTKDTTRDSVIKAMTEDERQVRGTVLGTTYFPQGSLVILIKAKIQIYERKRDFWKEKEDDKSKKQIA